MYIIIEVGTEKNAENDIVVYIRPKGEFKIEESVIKLLVLTDVSFCYYTLKYKYVNVKK